MVRQRNIKNETTEFYYEDKSTNKEMLLTSEEKTNEESKEVLMIDKLPTS